MTPLMHRCGLCGQEWHATHSCTYITKVPSTLSVLVDPFATVAERDADLAAMRATIAQDTATILRVAAERDAVAIENAKLNAELSALREQNERLRKALHEIAEEWAGAECGEPVYAQEAYAIGLAKRMYTLAAAALKG